MMIVNENQHAPLFSVIVPAYNSAEFINKCIDSVLMQTYTNFELIIVDDGSADDTLSICREYENVDDRIMVIHKENGGQTSARNQGLGASTGEYIIFLDSDDWLGDNVLALCCEEIEKSCPDVIVYSIMNTLTKKLFDVGLDCGNYIVDGAMLDRVLMDADGRSVFIKGLIGKVFKRSVIFENQLSVPKEVRMAEDAMAFVSAVLDSSSISVIENAVYYYCVREGSVSHSADAKAFERLPYLLSYYQKKLFHYKHDFTKQLHRYIIAQLYTSSLFVMRSGAGKRELDKGMALVSKHPLVKAALKNAKFNRKGYKFKLKKFILRHRMWRLLRILD